MNKKGQALVEFVLILPLFIFLIFAVVDFGVIFNAKNSLENDSFEIVLMVKNGDNIEDIKNKYPEHLIKIENEDEYYNIKIEYDVNLITPGFNRLFGDPYRISVERYIPYA